MTNLTNICSLDYLIGTLATAYKGLITSLVVTDFCISMEDRSTVFKGTIMSMPEGTYQISLIHRGIELAKASIKDGFFELKADNSVVEAAKNLQLDIIQNGKHIGTFLLKKETGGGSYVSALEISQNLKGINFRALSESVQGKKGLQKKSEILITSILTTKKNWRALSDEINTFSKDLYWHSRDAFYMWRHLLIRYSLKACEHADTHDEARAVSNALSLIELPLEKESDKEKAKQLVRTWMDEARHTSINYFSRFRQSIKIIDKIIQKIPEMDMVPLMQRLLSSLKRQMDSAPAIGNDVIDTLKKHADDKVLSPLLQYTEQSRNEMNRRINKIEDLMHKEKNIPAMLEIIKGLDIRPLNVSDMVESVFQVLREGLERMDDRGFETLLSEISKILRKTKKDLHLSLQRHVKELIKQMLSLKRTSAFQQIFSILKGTGVQDDIVLDRETAQFILSSGENQFIKTYKDILLNIPIPPPKISGFSEETWAEIANPLHLKRLAGFLDILTLDSEFSKDVLIHLLCNIFISGVFIPDDRLFQRNVSAYLNARTIREDYLLHYLLLKKLPVYYHDVGASGRIRQLSTEIDSWGNDPVIYFLRKQVHVNASNNNINLIQGIIKSWVYNDADILKERIPEDVLSNFDDKLLQEYSLTARQFFKMLNIFDGKNIQFSRLLSISDEELKNTIAPLQTTDEIKQKVVLICTIYQEILKKYSLHGLQTGDDTNPLSLFSEGIEKLRGLKDIFTSSKKTKAQESFYFKRHIAFGIPSVIGSYHEPKFDALSDTLRIEEHIRLSLEKVIADIEATGDDFNPDDMKVWFSCLEKINEFLKLHGIENAQVDEVITILRTNTLYLSQIIDLMRIWQRELTWTVELFYRTFHNPLIHILKVYPVEDLPDYLRRLHPKSESFLGKAADILIRDMINSLPGFEELDRILNSLIKGLSSMVGSGKDCAFSFFEGEESKKKWYVLHDLSLQDAAWLAPLIGSKTKNLVSLKENKLPVPYGIVFTSDITKVHEEYITSEEFRSSLRDIVQVIEKQTNRVFGSRNKPLFLSVRSGSYISMPGILSSILYCGLNEDTLKGFIERTGDPWLAWDSYRRFVEHYASIVLGQDERPIEQTKMKILDRQGLQSHQETDVEAMQEIVLTYLGFLKDKGHQIPHDVYEQLIDSIRAIYRSWFDEKALQFREAMSVSTHWGTAVTLMEMVYGNRKGSGASVFFTRVPVSLEKGLYGETADAATGDDLVYGKYTNRPLSSYQTSQNDSLEHTDPELYNLHKDIAQKIEHAMGDIPQEVEATYVNKEGKRIIYLLQTKRMEFRRGLNEIFHDICRMESSIIGRGVGVHGGALSGIVSFSKSPEEITKLKKESGEPIILLRKETSTEDVSVMPEIDGIVTSIGGATSHAAILSQKFDITAVVGCSDMRIQTSEKGSESALIGNHEIIEGTSLSIDGSTGLVYSGVCILTVKPEHY